MKILLLNPFVNSSHAIVQGLSAKGWAVLICKDGDEGMQMLQLQGASVDLAIVHREGPNGAGEPGLAFIQKFKAAAKFKDLPYVITTEKWSDAECAKHQDTPNGANAYLKHPFPPADLVALVRAVLGEESAVKASPIPAAPPKAARPPAPPRRKPRASHGGEEDSDLILEDAGSIFLETRSQKSSIHLDEPTNPSMMIPSAAPPSEPGLEVSEIEVVDIGNSAEAPAAPEGPVNATAFSIQLDAEASAAISEGAAIDLSSTEDGESSFGDASDSAIDVERGEPEPEYSAPMPTDPELREQMPYLFDGMSSKLKSAASGLASFFGGTPLGDAVVPGGAAQSPDTEVLKKYLLLREQDVVALSAQLKTTKEQNAKLEEDLRGARAATVELQRQVEERDRRVQGFEREKSVAVHSVEAEVSELRFQLKSKNDKVKLLESRVLEATNEIEALKERVRADIRKIRVREKDLENRLEILKKDSEVLITARENKIIDLKRKLDLVEFNIDLLQDRYAKEKEHSSYLKERLEKASRAMRVAGGFLSEKDGDAADPSPSNPDDREAVGG